VLLSVRDSEQDQVIVMLQNFADELTRRVPLKK
jgi:hypothetical protein